jgi:hypothetical protein
MLSSVLTEFEACAAPDPEYTISHGQGGLLRRFADHLLLVT